MHDFKLKIKLIYQRYLAIYFSLCALTFVIYWLLNDYADGFPFFSLIFYYYAFHFLLRPRLNLLKQEGNNYHRVNLVFVLYAAFTLFIPLLFFDQMYLSKTPINIVLELSYLFVSIMGCLLFFLIILLVPKIAHDKVQRYYNCQVIRDIELEEHREIQSYLIPKKGRVTTLIIVYASVVLNYMMLDLNSLYIDYSFPNLLKWGALNGQTFVDQQYWRLITNVFLDKSFPHWIVNCIFFTSCAVTIEFHFGYRKLLLVFVITLILTGFVSICWNSDFVKVGLNAVSLCLFTIIFILTLSKRLVFEVPEFIYMLAFLVFLYVAIMGFIGLTDGMTESVVNLAAITIGISSTCFMRWKISI